MNGQIRQEDICCEGKCRHPTFEAAKRAMNRIAKRQQGTITLNVYRCPRCKCWHVGNTMK